MAQIVSVKMSKFDNQPWGFRLQGGIDFAAPLTVQKVNGDSLAEKAGLRVGDALLRINETEIYQLRHKEAQDAVSRAGNNFELVVSRGGGMPKTAVKTNDYIPTPVQAQPAVQPIQQPGRKASLNFTAKPFQLPTTTTTTTLKTEEETNNNYLSSPPPTPTRPSTIIMSSSDETDVATIRAKEVLAQRLSGLRVQPSPLPPLSSVMSTPPRITQSSKDGGNVKLVNRQFNSPMNLYSEENIAETLSSQAEVLAQGVLGVNFKKNEKNYDPGNSEVFKMLQELEKAPREPEPGIDIDPADASPAQKGLASRTIQSRAFRRIQESVPLDSPKSPTERSVHFAPMSPPVKQHPVSAPSFPANNIGSSANQITPPSGGVRIFPAGPAPSQQPSTLIGLKPFTNQQTKTPTYSPAPPAVKPISFMPSQPVSRPAEPPTDNQGVRIMWPPPATDDSAADLEALPLADATSTTPLPPLPVAVVASPEPTVVDVAPTVPAQVIPPPLFNPEPVNLGCYDESRSAPLVADSGPKLQQLPQQMQQPPKPQQQQHQPSMNPGLVGIGSVAAASAALAAGSPAPKGAGSGIQSAPRRGKGVLSAQSAPGARIPVCNSCNNQIRGKFVTALGFTWCPDHFVCTMQQCLRQLQDIGFVEEAKQLYCEGCFETFLAPTCARCSKTVKGDCLNAIGKQFHPECFACTYCGRLFGNSHFYLEDGLPYCEADWNELFTTKCYACGYPIEAGDRWVEAMNNNYHSQCFTCAVCKKNLEGQSFLGKNGRPMCKSHAR